VESFKVFWLLIYQEEEEEEEEEEEVFSTLLGVGVCLS
jgi:hypothetical protein